MSTTRMNRLETLDGQFGVNVSDLNTVIQNVFSNLAPSTTVPTTRDNNTPLRAGDTYFNITLNAEYVYKTSGWVLNSDEQTLSKPTAAALIGAKRGDGTTSNVQDLIDSQGLAVVESVSAMNGIMGRREGDTMRTIAFFPGWASTLDAPLGGVNWVWSAQMPRTRHNGGSVRSPTVSWNGSIGTLAAFLAGTGETAPTLKGCWVDVDSTNEEHIEKFGARPGNSSYALANFAAIRGATTAAITHYPIRLEGMRSVHFGHGEYFIQGNSVLMPNRTQMMALPGAYRYRRGIKYTGQGRHGTILTLVSAGTGQTWFYDTTDTNFPGDTSVADYITFEGIHFRGKADVATSLTSNFQTSGFNLETYGWEKFITWTDCKFEWLDRVARYLGYGNADHNRMINCQMSKIREDALYFNNNQSVALTCVGVDAEEMYGSVINIGPNGGGDLKWYSGSIIQYPQVDAQDVPLTTQRAKALVFWENSTISSGPSSGPGNNQFAFIGVRIECYAPSQYHVYSFRTGLSTYGSLRVTFTDCSFTQTHKYGGDFGTPTVPYGGSYLENDCSVKYINCEIKVPYTFTVADNAGEILFDGVEYIEDSTQQSSQGLAAVCKVTGNGGSIIARNTRGDILLTQGDYSKTRCLDFTMGLTGRLRGSTITQAKHPLTTWPQIGFAGPVRVYLAEGTMVKNVIIRKLEDTGTTTPDYALDITSPTGATLGTTGPGISTRAITSIISIENGFEVPAAPNNYFEVVAAGSSGGVAFGSKSGSIAVEYM